MFNKLTFIIGFLCLVLITDNLSAQQTPEIMVYDFETKVLDTLKSFTFDGNTVNAKTDNYEGLKSKVSLDLNVPIDNLVEKTNFTNQTPVADIFENIAYPFSASVKLVLPGRDDRHQCTGVMISENFVLSSAHCTLDPYENRVIIDGLDAIAGYDESLDASQTLRAKVKRIYFIKDWNIGAGEDLAIYELDHPIGLFSGWMSIGFEKDQSKIEGEVMHKMSYPAYNTPLNRNEYDGKDLHLSYGVVDYVVPEYIGVKNHLVGAGGESGSPIFTTDNENDYTAHGVLTWAGFHNHSRFNAPVYYAYANILKNKSQVAGSILPVELTSFEAAIENDKVALNWSAEKEINLEGYEVERSLDGKSFEYIGFVDANNAFESQVYNFIDQDKLEGNAYYRLRSVDTDGTEELSEVRSVKLGTAVSSTLVDINIYPNPATDYVNINATSNDSEQKSITVYNITGQIMTKTAFTNSTSIVTEDYAAGTYHMIIEAGNQRESHTLLVQK